MFDFRTDIKSARQSVRGPHVRQFKDCGNFRLILYVAAVIRQNSCTFKMHTSVRSSTASSSDFTLEGAKAEYSRDNVRTQTSSTNRMWP